MVGPNGYGTLGTAELDAAIAYIEAHPEIWEVVLTGGDPFVLSPRRLGDVTARRPYPMSRCCAGTRACRWSIRHASRRRSSQHLASRPKPFTSGCTRTTRAN